MFQPQVSNTRGDGLCGVPHPRQGYGLRTQEHPRRRSKHGRLAGQVHVLSSTSRGCVLPNGINHHHHHSHRHDNNHHSDDHHSGNAVHERLSEWLRGPATDRGGWWIRNSNDRGPSHPRAVRHSLLQLHAGHTRSAKVHGISHPQQRHGLRPQEDTRRCPKHRRMAGQVQVLPHAWGGCALPGPRFSNLRHHDYSHNHNHDHYHEHEHHPVPRQP